VSPLLAAADATVITAFAVGVVSFISPCVLPLVPGYLSAISGVSYADLQEGEERSRVLVPAIVFCLSFTVMFVALGMTGAGIGATLQDHRLTLQKVSGALIIVMGVLFIAMLFVPAFNKEWRPEALLARAHTGGPVIAGLAFAVAWLPCTGPTLGAILTAAGPGGDVGRGALLLTFYSLGLAIPFLATALAFGRAMRVFRFLRDHFAPIAVASGLILIAMGVLLYTNQLTDLNAWLTRNGVNAISDL